MSRILLVDDSPHAQRMGERILSDEGYEVVTVSNADSALIRLEDVDPDVILADTVMPGRTGYEICQYVKMSPRHKHVRVILTAGVLESLDETQSARVEADGMLKKPFEATALIGTVKPLAEAAAESRRQAQSGSAAEPRPVAPAVTAAPFIAVVDAEQVRAAVTVALDAAMEKMVDEIASRVLETFKTRKPAPDALPPAVRSAPPASVLPPASAPVTAPVNVTVSAPVAAPTFEPGGPPPPAPAPRSEIIRRVNPVRFRPGSILGLDFAPAPFEPESPAPEPGKPASGGE